MLGEMTFKNEFVKRDYNTFLIEFDAANETGVRIRMGDQNELQRWRGGLMGQLIISGRLQELVRFFGDRYGECKMTIIDDVSPEYNGFWLYTVDASEEVAYVWRPPQW